MLSYRHANIPSSSRPLIHVHASSPHVLIPLCSHPLILSSYHAIIPSCFHPLMLSSPPALVHSSIHKLNPLILSSPNALVPKLSRPLITSVTSSSLPLIPSLPPYLILTPHSSPDPHNVKLHIQPLLTLPPHLLILKSPHPSTDHPHLTLKQFCVLNLSPLIHSFIIS